MVDSHSGHGPHKQLGRERVIEVFGNACPVCGHSVTGAHRNDESCELCGTQCGSRPWPSESVERYRRYQLDHLETIDVTDGSRTVARHLTGDIHDRIIAEATHRHAADVAAREAAARESLTAKVREKIGVTLEGHRGIRMGGIGQHALDAAAVAAVDVFLDYLRNPPVRTYGGPGGADGVVIDGV